MTWMSCLIHFNVVADWYILLAYCKQHNGTLTYLQGLLFSVLYPTMRTSPGFLSYSAVFSLTTFWPREKLCGYVHVLLCMSYEWERLFFLGLLFVSLTLNIKKVCFPAFQKRPFCDLSRICVASVSMRHHITNKYHRMGPVFLSRQAWHIKHWGVQS